MHNLVTLETSKNNNNRCRSVEDSCNLESDLSVGMTDVIEPRRGKYHAVFLKHKQGISDTTALALEHLQATHACVSTFSDLMQCLSSSKTPDVIGVHLASLIEMKNIDVLESISSIRTMCRCSSPHKTVALSVMADKNTDVKLLKELVHLDIQGFVTRDIINDLAETEHCFSELFAGHGYKSPSFIKRLHTKPKEPRREDPNTVRLTARQDQIARLICTRGASNKVIARLLDISESTVKLHVSAIFKKYGVKNRTQLALFSRDIHKA